MWVKHKPKLTLDESKTLDRILYVFSGGMLGLTLLTGTVLAASNYRASAANTGNSAVSVHVSSSCTLNGSVTTAHSASMVNGQYKTGIGSTTLTVYCNDPGGFVVYAVGDGAGEDVTEMVSSVNSAYNIETGLNNDTSHADGKSNWAMRVDPVTTDYGFTNVNSTYNGAYGVVPATYTAIASRTSGTDVPMGSTVSAVGAQITTTYAAYIATTQPAGTYTGKVKYAMLHPNDNETIRTLGEAIANTLGEKNTASGGNAVTVNGVDYYKMQNTAVNWDTICNATTILGADSVVTLADARDNELYTVTKLDDNKCWMTKNLNLAAGTSLSSDDTDFDSSYTLPDTNGWTVSGSKLVMPASSATGFSTDNYAYVYNSGSETCASSSPCYSYYSWDTATVGSGRSISTDNTDAPYSICPKGWHLPNTRSGTDSTSDFRALVIALGGVPTIQTYDSSTDPTGATIYNKLAASPNNFLRGGYYYGSSFYGGGSFGYYWSATSRSSTNARYLTFYSSYVNSAGGNDRRYGFSVRCIAGS